MNNFAYITKQILGLSKENSVVAFTCFTDKERKSKNANFKAVCDTIKRNGSNVFVVNYDDKYSGEVDCNATSVCNELSYNFQNVEIPENTLVLVNLKPISHNEAMLESEGNLNKVVLTVRYGTTSYDAIEKNLDVFKNNNIEVVGVIANKR